MAPRLIRLASTPKRYIRRKGKKQAERDNRGHHQARAEIAQQQYHHKNHNQTAQNQVFGNGEGGFADQFTSFQKGVDVDARRESALDFGHPVFYSFNYCFGIGIFEHHHLPQHLFAFSVAGNGPKTGGMTKPYLRHIFNVNGVPSRCINHNVFYILQGS